MEAGIEEKRSKYRSGLFLAPMVRIGTLPLRLLALEQGADLVWSPEMVDKSMVGCKRVVEGDIIRYTKNEKLIFYCHKNEKPKLIFQLGSADPDLALQAAKTVEQDVSGIDLNCGCPKKFSVIGGMGASLLYNSNVLCSILEKLVANISLPVSCKIRVLPDQQDTVNLVKKIAKTGVSAITVHCRTVDMRNRNKALWDRISDIIDAVKPIPVVLNGDVFTYDDFLRAKQVYGISSAMVARGVYGNISVFSSGPKVSEIEMLKRYIVLANHVGNPLPNTKYTLLQMYSDTKSDSYIKLSKSKTFNDYCKVFGIDDEYISSYLASLKILKQSPEKLNGIIETQHQDIATDLEVRKRGSGNSITASLESKVPESNSLKKHKMNEQSEQRL